MKISIEITDKQEKVLRHIYGDKSLDALFQIWLNEWVENRVNRLYDSKKLTKTLNQKIDELLTK
jgi:hypothetical protein